MGPLLAHPEPVAPPVALPSTEADELPPSLGDMAGLAVREAAMEPDALGAPLREAEPLGLALGCGVDVAEAAALAEALAKAVGDRVRVPEALKEAMVEAVPVGEGTLEELATGEELAVALLLCNAVPVALLVSAGVPDAPAVVLAVALALASPLLLGVEMGELVTELVEVPVGMVDVEDVEEKVGKGKALALLGAVSVDAGVSVAGAVGVTVGGAVPVAVAGALGEADAEGGVEAENGADSVALAVSEEREEADGVDRGVEDEVGVAPLLREKSALVDPVLEAVSVGAADDVPEGAVDAVELAVALLLSVAGAAEVDAVGGAVGGLEVVAEAVAEPEKTAAPLLLPQALSEGEAAGLALGAPLALTVPPSDAENREDCEGELLPPPTQLKVTLLHAKPAAQRGTASSVVQAGPSATVAGHHASAGAVPHPRGATTAWAEREAKVKAARGAQRAGVAPWQDSVAGAHSVPSAHRVAERGPE